MSGVRRRNAGVGGSGREAVHTWGKVAVCTERSGKDNTVSSTLSGHPACRTLRNQNSDFQATHPPSFVKASGRINEVLGLFHLEADDALFCIITHL